MLDIRVFPPVIVKVRDPIPSHNIPVGARIVYYLENKAKLPVQADFKNLCKNLDSLREQLRSGEWVQERVQMFVDYMSLIKTITHGFGLGKDAADIMFIWGTQSLTDINFDIVCLGFNVVLSALKSINQLDISNEGNLKTASNTVIEANFIFQTIFPLYTSNYEATLSSDALSQTEKALKSVFFLTGVAKLFLQRKLTPAARFLSSVLDYFSFDKDLHKYLTALSYAMYCDNLWEKKEFGLAIAYGRQAQRLIVTNAKKMPEPAKSLNNTLNSQFARSFAEYERINRETLADTVPSEAQTIPPLTSIPSIPLIPGPKPSFESPNYNQTLSEGTQTEFTSIIENYNEQAEKAFQDIDNAIAQIPYDKSNQVTSLYAELHTNREKAEGKMNTIYNSLLYNRPKLGQMFERYMASYNDYVNKMKMARNTDAVSETLAATLQSMLDPIKKQHEVLMALRTEVESTIKNAERISHEYEEASKNCASATELIKLRAQYTEEFEKGSKELQDTFMKIREGVNLLKGMTERTVQHYNTESDRVIEGFTQGAGFYTQLNEVLSRFLQQVSQ